MRKFAVALLLSGPVLAACSGNAGSAPADSSPAATTIVVTTTVASTTTEVALSTVDEPVVECDMKALRAAFNSKMALDTCTTTWAVGNTDRDTWNCAKAGCDQKDLYHFADNTWKSTATCHVDQPLTYWKGSCYRADMAPVTAADIPSVSIQCKIWPMNRNLRYLEVTGCEPTDADVSSMISAPCTHWFDNPSLPLEKCDSGSAVRTLQKRLAANGHNVRADGFFGGETVNAVMAEQKKAGLRQTAMVDLATWKALFPGNAGLTGRDANGNGVLEPGELG